MSDKNFAKLKRVLELSRKGSSLSIDSHWHSKVLALEAWSPPTKCLEESISLVTTYINKFMAHRPVPVDVLKRLIILSFGWVENIKFGRDVPLPVVSWLQMATNILPHIGEEMRLASVLKSHPDIEKKLDIETFLGITNTLCVLWQNSNAGQKCANYISTLRSRDDANISSSIYVLIRTARMDSSFDRVQRIMNHALLIADEKEPSRKPWIYITLANSALYDLALDKASRYTDLFEQTITMHHPTSWYRYYAGILRGIILLENGHLTEAVAHFERHRKKVIEELQGVTVELAWTNLFLVVTYARVKNFEKAEEYLEALLANAKKLPSYSFLKNLGIANLNAARNMSALDAMKKVNAALGTGHIEVKRFERYNSLYLKTK